MADDTSAQDRQLPASQRKIDKARREGQVARSRDLGHLATLGLGIAALSFGGAWLAEGSQRLLESGLVFDARALAQPQSMLEHLGGQGGHMLWLLAPLLAIVAVAAVAGGVLSGGWNFSWQALAPTWDKINPIAGFGRLFGLQQLATTLKACLLALVLGVVGALHLGQHWMEHAAILALPLPAALAESGRLVLGGLLLLLGVLALFALVDVPLQKQLLLRRLRMSVQEVKQEFKEVEGNAEVKAQRRSRMRELANRRMLGAVPKADLVVMNPSHFAVALKYDDSKMAAPRVVAKGADLLAFRIRDIAREARVPVLQAPPLARALYAHCEVDAEVPARLFTAVAQVLAWVYQVRDGVAAGRSVAAEAPNPEVPADLDPLNKAVSSPVANTARATDDPPL
jgi:flagellar biosynthesis protein FlhB